MFNKIYPQSPQNFCLTRWTKNEEIATKAQLTWDNVKLFNIIDHYQKALDLKIMYYMINRYIIKILS